ncbi:MAG: hypothetical protein DMF63_11745 [Acidobacteria bacterium]|nr:MAG: hypothetical protein DMF63_11745 [Acidobacteriota bacterium]
MQKATKILDDLAGIDEINGVVTWIDRVIFVFVLLTIIFAPHSIAGTQIAWLTGMFVWIIRLFFRPRIQFRFTALDAALWIFFAWSVLTSLTSYAPDISVNKLRGVAVFLIFYFVAYNIRRVRTAYFLAFLLIGSCMVNVLWTPVQRLIGRGVEMHGLAPEGPVAKALLMEGDTLLEANGRKIRTPEDLLAAVRQNETTKVKFYRPDFDFVVDVKRDDLLAGNDAMTQLGFSSWKKSHNWRSTGFYGHYATYSEVLQLIASLVFGLLVAFVGYYWKGKQEKHETEDEDVNDLSPYYPFSPSPFLPFPPTPLIPLSFCLVMMSLALLLTVTRASQLAFMISGAVIVLLGLGRKWFAIAGLIAIPIALAGVLFLQQSREVGFFDTKDDSIKWRQTVWREGFDLWTASPRNFILGVGMDSAQRYAPAWHMFDDGRLNPGHFHSTPLNLVVERGLPALLLWLIVLGVYARTLWRGLRSDNPKSKIQNPRSKGILLGCLGGMVGFFASGLVHYNLGDQEVAMMFFLLMAIGVRVATNESPEPIYSVDSD